MAAQPAAWAAAGSPRLRVATPQTAWRGDGTNAGQPWCQRPLAGPGHDVPSAARGRAGPAGSDEVPRPGGAVAGGASAEPPAVAVMAMAHWGADSGASAAPQARPLLSVAEAGGRQGGRPRRWNAPLQRHLCARLGRRAGAPACASGVPPQAAALGGAALADRGDEAALWAWHHDRDRPAGHAPPDRGRLRHRQTGRRRHHEHPAGGT
jgi:hypothetical protein